MNPFKFASLLAAAVVLAACGSRGGSKATSDASGATNNQAASAPESKPSITCVPVKAKTPLAASASKTPPKKPLKTTSKTTSKTNASSSSAASASSAAPSAPVSPNADGSCPAGTEALVKPAPKVEPKIEPKAAEATADKEVKARAVKSKDGSFEGEVYGYPAAGSKLAKIQIGMSQLEVEKLIGRPDDARSYVTAKAFVPFYFGSDTARIEWVYHGVGSVAFDAGRWGSSGVVMMINHDPKIK